MLLGARKTSKPYEAQLNVQACGSVISSKCQCAAGRSGVCSHSLAALKLIMLLKSRGYKQPPPKTSCTEPPQQWRHPHSIPLPLDFVNWRRVREGRRSEPLRARFYEATKENSLKTANTRRSASSGRSKCIKKAPAEWRP